MIYGARKECIGEGRQQLRETVNVFESRIVGGIVRWAVTGEYAGFATHECRAVLPTDSYPLFSLFAFSVFLHLPFFVRFYMCSGPTATLPLWNRAPAGTQLLHVGTRFVPRPVGSRRLRPRRNDRHLGVCAQPESRHHQKDQSFVNGGKWPPPHFTFADCVGSETNRCSRWASSCYSQGQKEEKMCSFSYKRMQVDRNGRWARRLAKGARTVRLITWQEQV